MKRNCILSMSLSGHGLSGVVCIDGEIVVATSLERLTRVKNDILFPISREDLKTFGWNADPKTYQEHLTLTFDLEGDYSHVDLASDAKFQRLLRYLLDAAQITLNDIDCVVYSYRHVESARSYFKSVKPSIEFIVPEHHFSHACQAFLPSPYEEAAIMVVDGQGVPLERTGGDQLSGCLAYGTGRAIETLWEIPVRHSLGGMYAAFTEKLGFGTNEEGKTMGLAPYGKDDYYHTLRAELKFAQREFNLRNWRSFVQRGFRPQEVLYSLPDYDSFLQKFATRKKKDPITDTHRNLAYAVQRITEDVMVYLADWLHDRTGSDKLCIAGGVALNCVANYQVLVRSKFKHVFVHPNAGDNGLAVGQALHVFNQLKGNARRYVATSDSLGRSYSDAEIGVAIEAQEKHNGKFEAEEYSDLEMLYETMAAEIAAGKITSWFQGRSEFGPRALGNRSILADPRRADMKDILNSRVKFRESFRPFTPSVLAERSQDYFELNQESPFMLLAVYVKNGMAKVVPAITHVDNTARVQTVTADVNEPYYRLIKAFERQTGVGMVLDTSFNVAGEPIVETPEDAIKCFLSTDIDVLCVGRFLLRKRR